MPSILSGFTFYISLEVCIIDHVLTSYIKLFMFILISNEPIKVPDLQKLANRLMLNGALVIDLPVKARKTLLV